MSRSLSSLISVLLLAVCTLSLSAADSAPAERGAALAKRVASACGIDAWGDLQRLRFTWNHVPSNRSRSYDWNVATGSVTVTTAGDSVVIPVDGPGADASEAATAAHKAFINDSYWLMFPLRMAWDTDLSLEDRGVAAVPGIPALGECRHLAVTWPAEGGYTPGDRYVLYLGANDLPLAWSYYPGGADEPRITTTRAEREMVAGLSLPTSFVRSDGTPFITVTELSAETRAAP